MFKHFNRLGSLPRCYQGCTQVGLSFPPGHIVFRLRIFGQRGHVSQVHQLLEGVARLKRILLQIGWVQAGFTLRQVPAEQRFDLCGSIERLGERAATHVGADRKSQQHQRCGSDIQQVGAVNPFAFLDSRPGHRQYAQRPMPSGFQRCPLIGGHLQSVDRRSMPIMIKAVIGNKDHRGLRPGHLQQRPQHQVVKLVHAGHDVAVQVEVSLRDVRHPGWVVLHEVMADGVDGFVENHRAVPRIILG